ncbi:gamma-aminobutyric acid receptor subunit rho-2-like [Brachionus plicatilis]|uniref:Gamma-aminobutyric acid receptor subunit rho-2-like n=1 Tax=Brachionus plicatilis TaxID=10195 RepID=A0A3M7P7W4_BRAPC|nr:gamma-aminobutyric acid receptor subunit rho-2-like [Brachionus plicatilis]
MSLGLPNRDVHISVQFMRFGEINTINERYYAEILIESNWIIYKCTDKYSPVFDWNPKLYIENSINEPKEEITYELQKFYNMTKVFEKRTVKGFFWEKLELEHFPLDVQELSIVICSKLKPNEVELKLDPERPCLIDPKAEKIFHDQQKWCLYKLVKVADHASYDECQEDDPAQKLIKQQAPAKFVVTSFCSRLSGYYLYNAYFIIFLITLLSLCIFSIDCKLPQSRLQTCFTLVLTSASFKWVTNRSLPAISYMTSLDKYSISCIFYLCLNCGWHSVVGFFWQKDLAVQVDLAISFKTIKDLERLNKEGPPPPYLILQLTLLKWWGITQCSVNLLRRTKFKRDCEFVYLETLCYRFDKTIPSLLSNCIQKEYIIENPSIFVTKVEINLKFLLQ